MDRNKKFVIALNREMGSGGRTVGRKLAERLGVKFYDKALIQSLTREFGLSVEEIEKIKAQKKSWWSDFNIFYMRRYDVSDSAEVNLIPTTEAMMLTETHILQDLASHESCVVAGRSGFHVFKMWPNHLNIFIQASKDYRIKRVMAKSQLSREEAIKNIEAVDKARENYVRKFTGTSRYDTRNYDLVVNMDSLTVEEAVEVIMAYIERSNK